MEAGAHRYSGRVVLVIVKQCKTRSGEYLETLGFEELNQTWGSIICFKTVLFDSLPKFTDLSQAPRTRFERAGMLIAATPMMAANNPSPITGVICSPRNTMPSATPTPALR